MGAWSTLALLGSLVAPESPPVALDWQAPAACPSTAAVQQRLAATLVDAPAATRRALTAAAKVTATADGTFALDLRVQGEGVDDERTLNSDACGELADATVLIVALAADPTVLDRGGIAPPVDAEAPADPPPSPADPAGSVPKPPDTATPTTGTTPAADAPTPIANEGSAAAAAARSAMTATKGRRPRQRGERAPRTNRPRRDRQRSPTPRAPVRLGLRALAGVGLAVGPKPTADLGLAGALWGKRWRTELGLTYWIPQEEQSPNTTADVRGRVQLWAFEPRGCFLPSIESFEFPLCGGLQIGAVHAVAKGAAIVEELPQRDLWLSAAFGVAAVWRPRAIARRRLGFWVRGEALPAIVQAGFQTESGEVFQVPALGGRVGAGLEVRLR